VPDYQEPSRLAQRASIPNIQSQSRNSSDNFAFAAAIPAALLQNIQTGRPQNFREPNHDFLFGPERTPVRTAYLSVRRHPEPVQLDGPVISPIGEPCRRSDE
jgi:hypothetical protein